MRFAVITIVAATGLIAGWFSANIGLTPIVWAAALLVWLVVSMARRRRRGDSAFQNSQSLFENELQRHQRVTAGFEDLHKVLDEAEARGLAGKDFDTFVSEALRKLKNSESEHRR